MLQTKRTTTVFVHGESGSGKTALVELLRLPVCTSRGYFVTGKYVQNSTVQEPYSAIMAAFSDLCDLTEQADDFDSSRQQKIQENLGSDAHQLLSKTITNLLPFVGECDPIVEMEAASSFSKFKAACKSFLHAMASDKHPIVVFLDDLQWADDGSRRLLDMFTQDAELKNVMFILAYRDEESGKVEDMLERTRDPVNIGLENLNIAAVHQVVSSILGSSNANIRGLSNLVAKRSAGNPFHIKMFLETIQRDELMTFEERTNTWMFNLDALQEEIMISETIADLLTRKIELLSPEITETLKVASLLGYRFCGSILVQVVSAMIDSGTLNVCKESVLASLSSAIESGFIESTNHGYHFAHDKLQASFQSMIDNRQEERLHLLIGEAYLTQGGDECDMYNAAVHLNRAPDLPMDSQQQAKLARINLVAARHCERKAAFSNAVVLLRLGLNALGPRERWSHAHFDLTFDLTERLPRTEMSAGDFEACKLTTKEALHHVKSVKMKIKLLLIAVEVRAI